MKNVFFEVTKRSLRESKSRTAATIFGVAVLVATITCVMCVFSSIQTYLVNGAKEEHGNWVISVENPSDDLKEKMADQRIPYAENRAIGYSYMSESKNAQRPFIFLTEMGPGMEEVSPVKIIKGRKVENSGEIVIPESLESNGGIKYTIGDSVKLSLGARINLKTGEEMIQQDRYEPMEEIFYKSTEKEFKVVGICERLAIEPAQAPGYTAIVKDVEPVMDSSRMFIHDTSFATVKPIVDHYADAEKISINGELLFAEGTLEGEKNRFYSFAVFMIIIIEFLGCILLNNTFMIAYAEKKKLYRMLASVGATPKQLRKIPFYESMFIGVAGIIFGMFAGVYAAVMCIALFGQDIVGSVLVSAPKDIYFNVNPLVLVLALVISVVSVLISTFIPASRVGKIKLVEEMNITSVNPKAQKQWVRQKKIKGKFLGIEGMLAGRYFKNNSGQYRLTIISMALCAFLLVSTSGLGMYAQDSISMLLGNDKGYDIVYSTDDVNEASASFIRLNDAEAVKESAYVMATSMYAETDKELYMYNVMAIDDATLQAFLLEENVVNPMLFSSLASCGIVVNDRYNSINYSKDGRIYSAVSGYIGGVHKTINIVGQASSIPTEMYNYINKPTIIISMSAAKRIFADVPLSYLTGETMFKSFDLERTVNDMEAICQNSMTLDVARLSNVKESRETLGNLVSVLQIIMYFFIFMLSMISLMNVFNMISADMDKRRREYATYNALGMTEKTLFKMAMYESMMLGGKTLAYAIPAAIMVIFMVYRLIGSIFTTKLMIPYTSILISVCWVLTMVILVTWYGIRQYRKEELYTSLKKRYNG